MKLRQSNIFTSVCQEFCPAGVSVPACNTGHMSGRPLSWEVSVQGGRGSLFRGFLSRGLCPGWRVCPGGVYPGGFCTGGLCPEGSLSIGVSFRGVSV